MSTRFPKFLRLLKRFQFQFVASGSLRCTGRYIIIDYRPNQLFITRLGIIITRKQGNSVQRNRFKRIVREAFRLAQLPKGYDIVVRPRNGSLSATCQAILEDFGLFSSEKGKGP